MDRQVVRHMFLTVLAVVWLTLFPESHASVEILPEVSLTVDGRAIIHDHAAVVSHPTVQEILAAFGRAEAAVQKQDLNPLLQFYAKGYNYHGLKPAMCAGSGAKYLPITATCRPPISSRR